MAHYNTLTAGDYASRVEAEQRLDSIHGFGRHPRFRSDSREDLPPDGMWHRSADLRAEVRSARRDLNPR
jgi:hypothetical protein